LNDFDSILTGFARLDPNDPAHALTDQLRAIPAKPCVGLFLNDQLAPLQLVTSKNLRALLRRRLADDDSEEPSRRVDYRSSLRGVRWRIVCGAFEADCVYLQTVRRAFADRWRSMLPARESWWVACDADGHPPSIRRVPASKLEPHARSYGPFVERSRADRWIESVVDAFDLCRYSNILARAPNGEACVYKQLNRCDAPCDGSVSMQSYRDRLWASLDDLDRPESVTIRLTREMQHHASQLAFEQAAAVKTRLDRLVRLARGEPNVGRVDALSFVTVQPGPRAGVARLFLVDARSATELAAFVSDQVDPAFADRLLDHLHGAFRSRAPSESIQPDADHLAIVAHHVSTPKPEARWLPGARLTREKLIDAIGEVCRAEEVESAASFDR
jgi:DNA polymerase-3 subunit epsilon